MPHMRYTKANHVAEVILFAAAFWGTLLSAGASLGEVATDGSLGPRQSLAGPDYDINADLGRIRGANLFHSFSEFDLSAGQSATFSGPDSITNIIGRVTGGTPSMIDGTLRSAISGADLFLLNPSGFLFGPNATLDVTGSFYAGTADYLRFSDNSRFSSTPASTEVLSAARPEAFGFLTPRPGDISVNGSHLEVPAGETLSLTAGNLFIKDSGQEDALKAPGGRIVLAGVGAVGEIRPDTPEILQPSDDRSGAVSISNTKISVDGDTPGQVVIRGGRIEIVDAQVTAKNSGVQDAAAPAIDVAAAADISIKDNGKLESLASGSGRGGDIRVTSENLNIENNGLIHAGTGGAGQCGDIEITVADEISIDGHNLPLHKHTTGLQTESTGTAAAGDVSVSSDMLTLVKGAQLVSVSNCSGDSGSLAITSDTISMYDSQIFTTVREAGAGSTGDIVVKSDNLKIIRSQINSPRESSVLGKAGNISINVTDELILSEGLIGAIAYEAGDGGDIHIAADRILVKDLSAITSFTEGNGKGGEIIIQSDTMDLLDYSMITSDNSGAGDGGTINLNCSGNMYIDNGWVGTDSVGSGKGGSIFIQAGNMDLDNEGKITSINKGNGGDGGTIDINCRGYAHLSTKGMISTDSRGAGNGGNILIRADSIDLQKEALINTKSVDAGDGGNIEIVAADQIRLSEGIIKADAKGAENNNGGNIQLSAPRIILNKSRIIANAYGGKGGSINILSNIYLADYQSIFDASSTFGIDGKINIHAPFMDISSALKLKGLEFLDIADLLKTPCDARVRGGEYSSFVVKERAGLPLLPDTLQISPQPDL